MAFTFISHTDRHYFIDDAGKISTREFGSEGHLPASMRKPYWKHFPGPVDGWPCRSLTGSAQTLSGIFNDGVSDRLFIYGRDPAVQQGRILYMWSEIELPDAPQAAEPEAPKPILVHTARRNLDGFCDPFELPGGHYFVQHDAPSTYQHNSGGKGWREFDVYDNRFSLASLTTLRMGLGTSEGFVKIYQLPPTP